MPIDEIDREIVMVLQHDARTPYAELGRRVGLTAPAIADRIRKLESRGVIQGYHAHVDLPALGRPIVALVRIDVSHDDGAVEGLLGYAGSAPEVLELHRTAGTEDFVARVAVESMQALEDVVVSLSRFGRSTTSMVLSSPVKWREVML